MPKETEFKTASKTPTTSDGTQPKDDCQDRLIEHFHRVFVHGHSALRCYVALLWAEGERRGRGLLNHAFRVLILTSIGAVGGAFFALGAAQWIESRLAIPGSGAMIVGMALVAILLIIVLTRVLRKERNP
jgi:hypothetical protein